MSLDKLKQVIAAKERKVAEILRRGISSETIRRSFQEEWQRRLNQAKWFADEASQLLRQWSASLDRRLFLRRMSSEGVQLVERGPAEIAEFAEFLRVHLLLLAVASPSERLNALRGEGTRRGGGSSKKRTALWARRLVEAIAREAQSQTGKAFLRSLNARPGLRSDPKKFDEFVVYFKASNRETGEGIAHFAERKDWEEWSVSRAGNPYKFNIGSDTFLDHAKKYIELETGKKRRRGRPRKGENTV